MKVCPAARAGEAGLWLLLLLILVGIGLTQGHLAQHQASVDTNLTDTLQIIARNDGSLDPEPYAPTAMAQAASASAHLPEELSHLTILDPEHAGGPEVHAHTHDDDDARHPPPISTGVLLILQQMGLREMAANLLWLQMDADSHHELWHRVDFYLELIPAIDPHFVEAFLLRSFVMDHYMNQHDEANALLEQGIKNNPLNDELPMQLGINLFNPLLGHGKKRDFARALNAFAAACRLPDHEPHADRFLAYTLAHLGHGAEAIAFLERIDTNPARNDTQKAFDHEAIARIHSGDLP